MDSLEFSIMPQCKGKNRQGVRCRNDASPGSDFCHIASHATSTPDGKQRISNFLRSHPLVTGVAFIASLITIVASWQHYHEGRLGATSGILSPIDLSPPRYISIGANKLEELNRNGIVMKDGDDPVFTVLQEHVRSGYCLWLWRCQKRILVSVKLKNAKGELVAEIRNNEWSHQPKPTIFDRNYTDNILEILDANTGDVALQVVDVGESVHVAGRFLCSHSGQTLTFGPSPDGRVLFEFDPPGFAAQLKIPPVCKYPGNLHLGECSADPIRLQLAESHVANPIWNSIQICTDLAAEELKKMTPKP